MEHYNEHIAILVPEGSDFNFFNGAGKKLMIRNHIVHIL